MQPSLSSLRHKMDSLSCTTMPCSIRVNQFRFHDISRKRNVNKKHNLMHENDIFVCWVVMLFGSGHLNHTNRIN